MIGKHIDKRQVITISNDLSEANYRLSINEQRLVLAFISKIVNKPSKNEYEELSHLVEYSLSVNELSSMFNMTHKHILSVINDTLDNLYEQSICIKKDGKKIDFRWIHYKSYDKNTEIITIKWTPDIIPLISILTKDFNSYLLAAISDLQSWYSLRLFMMMNVRRRTRDKTINYSVEQLRDIFMVDSKYQTFGEFNKHVLQPALLELNTKSDLRIKLKLNKLGKRVISVDFTITEIINMVEWQKQLVKEAQQKERLARISSKLA